eukprot:1246857-Pleurochrysis_carterae.AAC.1
MLQRVFKRLIAAGMTLKPSKSHILRKKLEVLGYIVTREGIRPNPEKLEALHKMPDKLKDNQAVLRFLGIVNFNRRFIRRLGPIASPLYDLLKKDVREDKWPWGELENGCFYAKAYKEIIDALASDVMLAHPDLHDPFAEYVIMTDASDVAAGAVLMQWQRGL